MSIHRLLSSSLTVPHWQTHLSAASDSTVLLRRRHPPSWKMHSESQILISQHSSYSKTCFSVEAAQRVCRVASRGCNFRHLQRNRCLHDIVYFIFFDPKNFHTADSPPVMFCSCSLCNVSFQKYFCLGHHCHEHILCNYKMVPSPILPYLEIHIIKKLNTRAATPKVKGQTSPVVFLLLSDSPGASEVPVLVFVPRQRRVYLLSPSTGVRLVCVSAASLLFSGGGGI